MRLHGFQCQYKNVDLRKGGGPVMQNMVGEHCFQFRRYVYVLHSWNPFYLYQCLIYIPGEMFSNAYHFHKLQIFRGGSLGPCAPSHIRQCSAIHNSKSKHILTQKVADLKVFHIVFVALIVSFSWLFPYKTMQRVSVTLQENSI